MTTPSSEEEKTDTILGITNIGFIIMNDSGNSKRKFYKIYFCISVAGKFYESVTESEGVSKF